MLDKIVYNISCREKKKKKKKKKTGVGRDAL